MSRFASCSNPPLNLSSWPPRYRTLFGSRTVLAVMIAIPIPARAPPQAIPLPAAGPPVQPAGVAQGYGGGFFEYLGSGGAASPRRGSLGILPAYAQIAPDADARRRARHRHHHHARPPAVSHRAGRQGVALWDRRRPSRIYLGGGQSRLHEA